MSKNNKPTSLKEISHIVTLVVAIVTLVVALSSLRISENVRDMTIPNGYYSVRVTSNRRITESKYLVKNHFSVDIQYYGSVPSKYIVIDLSISAIADQHKVIESDLLINQVKDDVIIIYNCPIGVNLRVMYEVNGTADWRANVKVFNIYSDCPAKVQHDGEEPYIIQSVQFYQPY